MATLRHYSLHLVLCLLFSACVACTTSIIHPTVASVTPVAVDGGVLEVQPSPALKREHQPVVATESLTPTLTPQFWTPTDEPNLTATPGATSLVGPVALLIIEPARQLETRAALLDPGAPSIHNLTIQEERLMALQWMDDGCTLYLNGKVYDLDGNLVWQVPSPIVTRLGGLYSARLSPQRNWLAYPVFSGPETYDSNEFVDVETISLTPPYSSYRLSQRGGAEVGAFVWSPDEMWVYFSDYDANGVLQIFRATPDGQIQEQMTAHTGTLGRVDSMSLSADGRHLAYSVVNLLATSLPYHYEAADEGWVGIVDVETRSNTTIRLPRFGNVYRSDSLWWSVTGDELLVYGVSLPIEPGDALYGKQLHWIRGDGSGGPFRSLYQSQMPGNSIIWAMPLSNLDKLFLRTDKGYYLLQGETISPIEIAELLDGLEVDDRIIDFIPGPVVFQDETACEK